MKLYTEIQNTIRELTTEDAYGSWELWWAVDSLNDAKNISKPELQKLFIEVVTNLVNDDQLAVSKFIRDQNIYEPASLDVKTLESELKKTIEGEVDSDSFYWFFATPSGKENYYKIEQERFA